jgi:hypothetical protein
MEKILPNQVLVENYRFIAFIVRDQIRRKRLDPNLLDDLLQEASLSILKNMKKPSDDKTLLRWHLKKMINRSIRLYLNRTIGANCNERKTEFQIVHSPDDDQTGFLDSVIEEQAEDRDSPIIIEQIKKIASNRLTGLEYDSVFSEDGNYNAKQRGLEKLKRYVS